MSEITIDTILNLDPNIRYCAIYSGGVLTKKSKADLGNSQSSDESDKYEELFVNPAVLTLAHQRGELDCGGTKWVLIRYGNFFQWIKRTQQGHISVCIEAGEKTLHIAEKLHEAIQNDQND